MPNDSNHRVFLGFDRPPLVSAADWLLQTHRSLGPDGTFIDLSDAIVVLPSSRNRIRLLQLLTKKAKEFGQFFKPPLLTTIGHLPEFLYSAQKPLATDLAQQLAWARALKMTPDAEIESLTGQRLAEQPTPIGLEDWHPLAILVSKLHTRLANDIWSFNSVARAVEKEKGFLKSELERWRALKAIQQRYYSILADVDLWDKQAARSFAAAGLLKAGEIRCSTNRQIVLVGIADLNRSVSEMLRQIASVDRNSVQCLIAAPDSLADRFNEFGSLITEQWLTAEIDIKDQQILYVDRPSDQANATACFLSDLPCEITTDEITVGTPDSNAVQQLERSLNAIGLPHRNLAGRLILETAPVQLVAACTDYLGSQTFESLTALVRHPDMFRWICKQVEDDSWIKDLDSFQNNHLPSLLPIERTNPFGDPDVIGKSFSTDDPGSRKRAQYAAESAQRLNQILEQLTRLLAPLVGVAQPIAFWTRPWSDVLISIYGEHDFDPQVNADREILNSCDALFSALNSQNMVPADLGMNVTADQALDWAIIAASEHRIVAAPIPDAVEFAGWLDLPLDDAPVIVVTGMNDDNVPSSEIGNQFLPNELCKQLGILDNDRRYARDAYAMTVIAGVRERLLLIATRRDETGEPKKPSRLLFCTDPQTAARRAKAFFDFQGESPNRFWITDKETSDCQQMQAFGIPRPDVHSTLGVLSVTKFRDFMKCPYRFYLKHIMKLEAFDDQWQELSGGTFGDLTHNVLEAFGKNDCRDSTQEGEILKFLLDQLDTLVNQQFSGSQLPAVLIQIQQLRLRLEQFSTKQAERRRSGWRIVSTEELLEHPFDVDGSPFIIRGKIDRVDQHEVTGQIAVWDYKSSDKGAPPNAVHYASKKKEWKDLQLPLYRHLVKEVQAVAQADFSNILMGYILLPKKLDEVGFHEASWTHEELSDADESARQIIRKIRENEFWPKTEKPPIFSEEFAAICQDNVFEQSPSDSNSGQREEVAPW